MNTIKLAVGILFVVLVSKTCTLATAQDVDQLSVASVLQADPPEHSLFLAGAQAKTRTALTPDQQGFTSPSITESQDDCYDGCFRSFRVDPCPRVYAQVGALFIQEVPRFTDQPIVVDPNTNTTFLSTSDLDSNFEPGLQATVGIRLPNCRVLEFDYFGLFGGTTSAVAVRPDSNAFLIFPNNLAGNVFVDMDRAQADYSSTFNSFAVNSVWCSGCCDEGNCGGGCDSRGCDSRGCDECGCDSKGCGEVRCRSFTWFTGFRYLNLNQRLNISAQRAVAGGVEEGTYNVRTTNNLYGAQLGARLRRTSGRFGWDATGFAGIFGNDARQTQSVTDFPNFPLRPTVSSSRGGVAFVGGANLSALYSLTDVWNLRAGYNVIWVEGLALAPDQLDFNFATSPSGNQLHNGGGMFLHGANVGLEARW